MSTVQLPSIFRAIQEIFPDTVLRTGFSTQHQTAFIVAADLRDGVGHTGSTNKFLQPLLKGEPLVLPFTSARRSSRPPVARRT